MFLIKVEP